MINVLLVGLSVVAGVGVKIEAKQPKAPLISNAKQQPAPALCEKVWIAGHYEARCEQVFVEAHHGEIWVEPAYITTPDGQQILWANGYWKKIYVPGRYELRRCEVWVPGTWVVAASPIH